MTVGPTDVSAGVQAMERFVAGLRAGLDSADADLYDKEFASDLLWGSPYGSTLAGFASVNAAHRWLMGAGAAPASRYEIVQVLVPKTDMVIAHVRRQAIISDESEGFSEMAMYVLVERDGQWWLVGGQNTPVRQSPS